MPSLCACPDHFHLPPRFVFFLFLFVHLFFLPFANQLSSFSFHLFCISFLSFISNFHNSSSRTAINPKIDKPSGSITSFTYFCEIYEPRITGHLSFFFDIFFFASFDILNRVFMRFGFCFFLLSETEVCFWCFCYLFMLNERDKKVEKRCIKMAWFITRDYSLCHRVTSGGFKQRWATI